MFWFETYWEPLALLADGAIVYFLYRAYKSRGKEAEILHKSRTFKVGPSLEAGLNEAPGKCLDYVTVEGVTSLIGDPLRSQFTQEIGVLQHQLLVEHKAKRVQGSWTDYTRIIRDVLSFCPFYIVGADGGDVEGSMKVEVTEILTAEYLDDYLPVVHDKYEPVKDSLLSRGMDLLFGTITKGYEETERMLGVGVPILGVGRITSDGKRILLQPPTDGRKYVVTTLSKTDVVRLMQSNVKTIKILFWFFTVFGIGILGYSLYKYISQRISKDRLRRALEEVHRQIAAEDDGSENKTHRCVVCLCNRRDVVNLNCGHVCVCASCADALPEPKYCPVCRSRVVRFVPVYIS